MGNLLLRPAVNYYIYPEPRLTFNIIDTAAALELQQQSCDLISKLKCIAGKGADFSGVSVLSVSQVMDQLNNVINFLLQKEAIATCQFKAKLGSVKQHLNDLCGSGNSTEEQEMGISQAVTACNEIFKLFDDKKSFFYKYPLLYINMLLSFAVVHKTVLVLAKKIMPSVYGPSGTSRQNKEEELRGLVQLYINRFKEERLSENIIFTKPVFHFATQFHSNDIGLSLMDAKTKDLLLKLPKENSYYVYKVVDKNYPEKEFPRLQYGGYEESEYIEKLWNLYNSEFCKILDQL